MAGGVPTQWAKVADYPDLDRRDIPDLRLCILATAPMPPDLVERITERLGCPVVVRYAMTESPSISGTDPGDPPNLLYRTVGRPQAGVEVAIRTTDGTDVLACRDRGRPRARPLRHAGLLARNLG